MTSQLQKNQTGFSLIEMMVAMLIGLFLMGGVVSVYISSSQSSRINDSLRTLQENGRFALASLKNTILMAGYVDSYDPSVQIDPFPGGAADFNQKVTVRYESDVDCTGTPTPLVAAPGVRVANNTLELNGGELRCVGNAGGAGVVIIDGVDQMQFLYGLDDDGDEIADRYVTAGVVTAATGWQDKVSSVRVSLLLNSTNAIKPANESKTYQLLDVTTAAIDDRLLHKVFTTTILIRNRMS